MSAHGRDARATSVVNRPAAAGQLSDLSYQPAFSHQRSARRWLKAGSQCPEFEVRSLIQPARAGRHNVARSADVLCTSALRLRSGHPERESRGAAFEGPRHEPRIPHAGSALPVAIRRSLFTAHSNPYSKLQPEHEGRRLSSVFIYIFTKNLVLCSPTSRLVYCECRRKLLCQSGLAAGKASGSGFRHPLDNRDNRGAGGRKNRG